MMRLMLSFLLVSVFKTCLCQDPKWCYESQKENMQDCKGPNEWTEVNEACGGAKQSPIKIMTKDIPSLSHKTEFIFTGYNETATTRMQNNKRTVTLEMSPGATLTWEPLSYKYNAMQVDFHWGDSENPGSEHFINDTQYAMEMQVLHVKDTYNSAEDAENDPTGVAILAFFIKVSEDSVGDNEKYASLITALTSVTEPDTGTDLTIPLNSLILTEVDMKDYYYYEGSTTKPSCQPAIWIVFKEPIQLSKAQVDGFQNVKFTTDTKLVKNYRPVQSLNGRVVYSGVIPSSGAVLGVSFTFILMCLSAALGCCQLE